MTEVLQVPSQPSSSPRNVGEVAEPGGVGLPDEVGFVVPMFVAAWSG